MSNIKTITPRLPKDWNGYTEKQKEEFIFRLMNIINSKLENDNCLSYIKTKLFRALFFYNRHSLNISRSSFELIPIQDFTNKSDINWTKKISEINQELYEKYNLTRSDIKYIEDNIKEMI